MHLNIPSIQPKHNRHLHLTNFACELSINVGLAGSLGKSKLGIELCNFHLHYQLVSRDDGLLPLDSVDSAEEEERSLLDAVHLQGNDTSELCQCLDLHDAGEDGLSGEVTGELWLVVGDGLDADGPLSGLVLDDLVHEGERVAVGDGGGNVLDGEDGLDVLGEAGDGLGTLEVRCCLLLGAQGCRGRSAHRGTGGRNERRSGGKERSKDGQLHGAGVCRCVPVRDLQKCGEIDEGLDTRRAGAYVFELLLAGPLLPDIAFRPTARAGSRTVPSTLTELFGKVRK